MENNIDGGVLFEAYHRAIKGSKWKQSTQKYGSAVVMNLAAIQHQLETGTYKTGERSTFIVHERGKTRMIHGNMVEDRIVRHVLCDEVLTPTLEKYLIYDNGASQVGKGIAFTRKRLEVHLHKYFRHYGNRGYILLVDFSKYYDNIRHGIAFQQIAEHVHDETALAVLREVLDNMKIDVSYMSDEEYAGCMDRKFDSVKYSEIPNSLKTGEKFMRKCISIGDQTAQNIGIFYPTPVDNYVKIVRGQKYYGRYMDDSYVISPDKEELKDILRGIREQCAKLGIFINEKKTQIYRIDRPFHFLQNSYSLTETGKVVVKINKKRLVAMRRKLRKLASKLENGEIQYSEIEQMYRSWIGGYYKLMSRKQRENLNNLYNDLFIKPFIEGRNLHERHPQNRPVGRNQDQRHVERQ